MGTRLQRCSYRKPCIARVPRQWRVAREHLEGMHGRIRKVVSEHLTLLYYWPKRLGP